mgnify:CR=1 FL=1
MGRRKVPVYSIVATDSRSPRDGRYIEDLGRYYPLEQPAEVRVNEERVLYWLEQGAQPSDTVRSILRKRGLLLATHLKKKGKSEPQIEEAVAEHRAHWAEKEEQNVKLTAEARRQKALEAERQRIKELEEEEARRRAEARKKQEEEAAAAEEAAAEEAAAEEAAAEEAEAPAAEAEDAEAATAETAEAEEAEAEEAEAEEAEAASDEATAEAAEEDESADEQTAEDEEEEK